MTTLQEALETEDGRPGAQADDSLTARSTWAYETGGPLGLQKHGVP